MPKKPLVYFENFEREADAEGSSNRNFGFVFTAFFALVAFAPLLHGKPFRPAACALSALFLAVTFLAPDRLAPLNKLWTKLGLLLHHVTTPIFMGLIFFLVLTPLGLLVRLGGRDPMRRRLEPGAASYWLPVDPERKNVGSMRDQF